MDTGDDPMSNLPLIADAHATTEQQAAELRQVVADHLQDDDNEAHDALDALSQITDRALHKPEDRCKDGELMRALGFSVSYTLIGGQGPNKRGVKKVVIDHQTFHTGGIGGQGYRLEFGTAREADAWFEGYHHALRVLAGRIKLEK
jgi:hypothetical protein